MPPLDRAGAAYRRWHRERPGSGSGRGAAQFVQVEPYIWVANVAGRRGIRTGSKKAPVRYEAIDAGPDRVAAEVTELGASVHMPRIGRGLAGGTWPGPLVTGRLVSRGIDVTMYDFGG